MRLVVILLSLLAAALIVAGCGGGGSGTGASSGSTAASTSEEAKGEDGKKGKEEEGPVVNEEAGEGKEAEAKEGEEGEGEEGKEGGEEKEKPSSEKAALIKEGDEICNRVPETYGKTLQALEKKNGGKQLPTKEANLKAAVPPLYTAVEELEQLSAPSGEEEELEAIVTALEAAAKGLEKKPGSPLSGPKSPFAEFQKLTGEYGFQVCSQL